MISYSVLVIKPLSVRREDGPKIIQDILDQSGLHLVKLRVWDICDNTWFAIEDISKETESQFILPHERISTGGSRLAWVCLFKCFQDNTNATKVLQDLCGPEDRKRWSSTTLRYKYSPYKTLGEATYLGDNVVYISPLDKEELVASILFTKFKLEDLINES